MATYYLSNNRESIQDHPFIHVMTSGNILGIWDDFGPDPGYAGHVGVYSRIMAPDLRAAMPNDIPVPDLRDDIQRGGRATSFADGSFAVTFESRGVSARDGTEDAFFDSYIKFYDANGTSRGPARQITPNSTDDHYSSGVVTLSNNQAMALVERYEGGGASDLVAYRFDAKGRPVGKAMVLEEGQVRVSSLTGGGSLQPDIAAGPDGTYAVTWQNYQPLDGAWRSYVIKTRVFEADGRPASAERVVAAASVRDARDNDAEMKAPEIAARSVGGFALGWTKDRDTDDEADVWFRLLRDDGSGRTNAVLVNDRDREGDQHLIDVVDLEQGYTLVTWMDIVEDAFGPLDGGRILARVMGPDGRPAAKAFALLEDPVSDFVSGNTVINKHGDLVTTYGAREDVFVFTKNLQMGWRNGTEGNNRIDGTLVDDRIDGKGGHDRIHGGRGDDVLRGGSGHDRVYGGEGNDRLEGGSGDDRLAGERGNDRLTGGRGADLFVFDRGRDVITDFEDGRDLVQIRGASREEVRTLLADRRQDGDDTVVDIPGGSIRFEDTDRGRITLADFLF